MFRRGVTETPRRRLLDRLANRLVKIVGETKKLKAPEKLAEIGRLNGLLGDYPFVPTTPDWTE